MNFLIALLVFQVHADEYSDSVHDSVMGAGHYEQQLAMPIEQPTYQAPQGQGYLQQSDSEWSRSVQQMDQELKPRY